MKTKNIFKTLAMALLLPAMLLTTACSNSDDDAVVNNNEQTAKKGYPLQVTVNVTREGDEAATRATYTDNGDKTGSLSFSAGDQLFVWGSETTAGQFAGTLTWDGGTSFSGTITTKNLYTGTADALFTAANSQDNINALLLPNDYENYHYISSTGSGYETVLSIDEDEAFAPTKAEGVEQLTCEFSFVYNSGFTLSPRNAILNFTITGLTASSDVNVSLTESGSGLNISKTVTTDASGSATFAVGVYGLSVGTNLNDLTLTVGGNAIALGGSKELVAGKIYNINRAVGALAGKFSVSSTKQVYFSKGNLQATYDGSSWTWAFAENQWDYIGGRSLSGYEDQTGNNYISGNGTMSADGTVDLFCWSTNATYYGIHNSEYSSTYSGDFYDWGNAIGSGWRTLTPAEWEWILGPSASPTPGTNCRTSSTVNGVENARYAKATVVGKAGLIIFPDSYTHPGDVTAPASVNTADAAYNSNSYDATAWGKMEAAGAVFLPAAGSRSTSVQGCGVIGGYWSSVVQSDDNAYSLAFQPSDIGPSAFNPKRFGASVRLVKDAN